MSNSTSPRRSRLFSLASRAVPSFASHSSRHSHQPLDSISSHPQSILQRRDNSLDNPYSSVYSHTDPFASQSDDHMGDDFLPHRPFADDGGGSGSGRRSFSSSRRPSFSSDKPGHSRPASLSINYVPTKFTRLHAPGQWAHRRVGKQGGGRDAFAKNASRMGMMGTVDDDEGIAFRVGPEGDLKKKKPKLRWNRFKWILFVANSVLFSYGIATLVCAILVWLNIFYQSDVIRVGNRTELILSTIAASLIVFTSLLGFSGIILNNRGFLAVYTVLLWVCFAFMVAPGYISYKQKTFNLEGKLNLQWSRILGTEGRLRVQNALRCCGYYSPFYEATQSPLCYSRSIQPGCKVRYLHIERHVLETWYTIAFALVPAHLLIILAALLCSNHITYRFGKGLTPKRYRLDLDSMAVIMDNYASEIADKYGPEVANVAMSRSSSQLNVNEMAENRNSFSQPGSRRGSFTNAQRPYSSSNLLVPSSSSGNNLAGAGSGNMMRGGSAQSQHSHNSGQFSGMSTMTRQTSNLAQSPILPSPASPDPQDGVGGYSDEYDPSRESFYAAAPYQQPSVSHSVSGQFDDPPGHAR